MKAENVRKALKAKANASKARLLQGFFKTGPGEYAEGDIFLGLTVPQQRAIGGAFRDLPIQEAIRLLRSKIHEERLTALIILTNRYRRDESARPAIARAYLGNLKWVNNWDLVDLSTHIILGPWLEHRSRAPLYKLARSKNLWERRVAMVATSYYIYHGDHRDCFKLAEILMKDEHDLMHKAVGWMLREVGKRVSPDLLRGFLKKNAARMPRTALRYSIERFSPAERKRWLEY